MTYDDIKSLKKPEFHPLFRKKKKKKTTIRGGVGGGGVKLTPQPF